MIAGTFNPKIAVIPYDPRPTKRARIVDHFSKADASQRSPWLVGILCDGDNTRKTYRQFPQYRAPGQLWSRLGEWT